MSTEGQRATSFLDALLGNAMYEDDEGLSRRRDARLAGGTNHTDDRVRRERDLFARMLELGRHDDVDTLLREALAVAVDKVQAAKGYLAVFDLDHTEGEPPRWSAGTGFEEGDRAGIERELSSTIIQDTLVTRRVKLIDSAQGHPKYAIQDSVRVNRITSVLCAPLGRAANGILYLQDRAVGGVFSKEDEHFLVRFGELLTPFVDRLVDREHRPAADDPTRMWRRDGRFSEIVGRSQALADVMRAITRCARSDTPVLVTGPSGSGKTTLARELHAMSQRAQGPFIALGCGTLHADDAAERLFGADGVVARAEGGTLFLDTVDALPTRAQAALLSFVEHTRYRPTGGGRERSADVRIVAATHHDLPALVREGAFHDGLYQRLKGLRVHVPSLAERGDDIALLIEDLGKRHTDRLGLDWLGVAEEFVDAARGRAWPGNVRELSQAIEQAILEVDGQRPLAAEDLHAASALSTGGPRVPAAPRGDDLVVPGLAGEVVPWKAAKKAFATAYLELALQKHDGNKTATARTLELSRSRMFALLNELDIDLDQG